MQKLKIYLSYVILMYWHFNIHHFSLNSLNDIHNGAAKIIWVPVLEELEMARELEQNACLYAKGHNYKE